MVTRNLKIDYNQILQQAKNTLSLSDEELINKIKKNGFNEKNFDANRVPLNQLARLFEELDCEIFLMIVGCPYDKDLHLKMIKKKKAKYRNKNILYVDDNVELLELFGDMIRSTGISCTLYSCPLKALEVLKTSRNNFDLVISDYQMPSLNGVEFIRKASKIDFKHDVKFALFSSHVGCNGLDKTIERELEIIQARVTLIPKPIQESNLVESLMDILNT